MSGSIPGQGKVETDNINLRLNEPERNGIPLELWKKSWENNKLAFWERGMAESVHISNQIVHTPVFLDFVQIVESEHGYVVCSMPKRGKVYKLGVVNF